MAHAAEQFATAASSTEPSITHAIAVSLWEASSSPRQQPRIVPQVNRETPASTLPEQGAGAVGSTGEGLEAVVHWNVSHVAFLHDFEALEPELTVSSSKYSHLYPLLPLSCTSTANGWSVKKAVVL